MSAEIVRAAEERRLPVSGAASWGLDHGAWLPLYFMFPELRDQILKLGTPNLTVS